MAPSSSQRPTSLGSNFAPMVSVHALPVGSRTRAVGPVINAEHLYKLLPHSKLSALDVGHFVGEDAQEYHRLINEWISAGYRS